MVPDNNPLSVAAKTHPPQSGVKGRTQRPDSNIWEKEGAEKYPNLATGSCRVKDIKVQAGHEDISGRRSKRRVAVG